MHDLINGMINNISAAMNRQCRVCMEALSTNDSRKPFVTPCGHLFHENCIKNCLQNITDGKCPQCKQMVDSSKIIQLFIINESAEKSTDTKQIEQLKREVIELKEKTVLQRDLIESLKRQILLEQELNNKEKDERYSQPIPLTSPFTSLNAAKRPKVITTPKQRDDSLGAFSALATWPPSPITSIFGGRPFGNFSTFAMDKFDSPAGLLKGPVLQHLQKPKSPTPDHDGKTTMNEQVIKDTTSNNVMTEKGN